jgi:hypothetical protein
MRLLLLAAASVILAGAAVSATAEEDGPILPGYWESISSSTFSSAKTERKCISARAINSYLTGPVNSHYACHYDTRELKDGHAQMAGECEDSSGLHSKIKIDGTYGPEAFKLSGRLQVVIGGLKIPVSTSIDAHRLGAECPAGLKVEDGGNGEGPRKKSKKDED